MPARSRRKNPTTTAVPRGRCPSSVEGELARRSVVVGAGAWRAVSLDRRPAGPTRPFVGPASHRSALAPAVSGSRMKEEMCSSLLGLSEWRGSPQDALYLGEQPRGELRGAAVVEMVSVHEVVIVFQPGR